MKHLVRLYGMKFPTSSNFLKLRVAILPQRRTMVSPSSLSTGVSFAHFPDYSTVTETLQDTSLESKGFVIQAFVCCNIHEVQVRHFWLLEVQNGKPVWLFDSLGGLTPITLEVTKKLSITGFLLDKKAS